MQSIRQEKNRNTSQNKDQSNINQTLEVGHAKYPLAIRIPLAVFLITIITASVVGTTFHIESNNIVTQKRLKDVEKNGKLLSVLLNNFYEDLNDDVVFLYGTPPVQEIIKASTDKDKLNKKIWKTRLETIFSTMLYSNSAYTKIRFIGVEDKGRELIRVDRRGYNIIKTHQAELQQKEQRGYFKASILYEKGAVYFSKTGLNHEHGKISLPHRPVIRAAMPVYDEIKGIVFGIIIITADYNNIVAKMLDAAPEDSKLYVANQAGDFLIHPNKSKTFGFDLGQSFKMQDEFPLLANIIANNTPIFPVIALKGEHKYEHVGHYATITFDRVYSNHPLRLLLVVDDKTYLQSIATVRMRSIMLAFSLSLIALIIAVFASRRLTAPLMQMSRAVQEYERTGSIVELPIDSRDEIGVLARAFHNVLDMVKKKTADAESASARMQAIVETAADAIITIDTQGDIQSFNHAAEKIFGYDEAEVIGQNINMLMPAPYKEEHDTYLANYMTSGEAKIIGLPREVEALRKNGEKFPIDLSISEVKTQGERLFTGVLRDISLRKASEEILVTYAQNLEVQSQELQTSRELSESANLAKSEFLANMSHEIRTPMNGIIGTCSLMAGTKLTKKQQKYLETITNSSASLLQIINDILDFSKIEAGKLEFENLPFNLLDLMEDITNVMRIHLTDDVKIKLHYASDMPRYVWGDSGRIRQILFNLISNAIKFTSEGYININIKSLGKGGEKYQFMVSIEDSGIGIPEDKLDHIFQKFNQAEESTTRRFGGTGLGLSICSELVQIMGGEIHVESMNGEGSKFIFTMFLDLATEIEAGRKGDAHDPVDIKNIEFQNLNVLIAEDNRTNMMMVTEMLEQCGCQITPAKDGLMAVEYTENETFDIIFMDCRMPKMDGYDATETIRDNEKKNGSSATTIIALTANAMKGDRDKCLAAGMDDYIAKPVTKESIAGILLKWVPEKQKKRS